MPSISIVTPSLNQGEFLRAAIESVLHQEGPSPEYLVVDGASTDGTVEILESYGPGFRWISEPDKGQADAINKGFRLTTGEVLGWLNADDLYCPGALNRIAQEFETDPNLMMIYGKARHVDADGNFLEEYPTTEFSLGALSYSCFICQPACFFRRSLFEAAGGVNPDLHYALDLDLWIRFGMLQRENPAWRFRYIPQELAMSRMHRENKTLSMRHQAYQEIMQVVKKQFGHVSFNWIYGASETASGQYDGYFRRSPFSLLLLLRSLMKWGWSNRNDPVYVFRIIEESIRSPRKSASRIGNRIGDRF